MIGAPLYQSLRGGRITWHVDIIKGSNKIEIEDNIVSITGLHKSITFDGTTKSAAVTVIAAGFNLPAWVTSDALMYIGVIDGVSGGEINYLWAGFITNFESGNLYIKIEAAGLFSKIKKDTELYNCNAANPRQFYRDWLNAAIEDAGGYISDAPVITPAYDDYFRQRLRVAAPIKTAADLPLIAGSPNATGNNNRIRVGTTATTYGSWRNLTAGDYPVSMYAGSRWAPFPQTVRALFPRQPLLPYAADCYFQITAIFAKDSVYSTKSAFPAGVLEYATISGFGLRNPTTNLTATQGSNILSSDKTQSFTVEYSSRAEGKAAWDQNGGYWKANRRKVYYSDVLTPDPVGQSWTATEASNLGISALLPTNYTAQEPAGEIQNMTLSDSAELLDVVKFQQSNIAINLQITPRRVYRDWRAAGVTSTAGAGYRYQWQEYNYLCTCEPAPITQDFAEQAGYIGQIAAFEVATSPDWGDMAAYCYTAPDQGEVFPLPLTVHTVTAVTVGEPILAPSGHKVTATTPWGDTEDFYRPATGGGSEKQIDILQAYIMPGAEQTSAGSWQRLNISSNDRRGTPLFLGDRLTGSQRSSGRAYLYAFSGVGELTTSKGEARNILYDAVQGAQDSAHCITDSGRVKYFNFMADGSYITIDRSIGQQAAVETTAIKQNLAALAGVFGAADIQTFNITASLAFATINPGDCVVVSLPTVKAGEVYLAMVVEVAISTDSPTVDLVVALMRPAESYLTAGRFAGLQNALMQV